MLDLAPSMFISHIVVLLVAFPIHEFAHAWTANFFGDDTPRLAGRLTLNPLVHLDVLGSILLVVAGFGWAKPVPINPYVLSLRSSAAYMLVSLAGPASNFFMAVLAAVPFQLGLVTAADAQLHTAENQVSAARASLKESEANVSVYKAKLAQTIITSSISGTIVFKALEKGEAVSPGVTIFTIVDLNNLYVRVDVEETRVGGIALNQPAIIHAQGASERIFKGKVSEIGRYAEFATQKDVTRGRQDIKTFKVKIEVEDSSGFLKPGMTVNVEMTQQDVK